MRFLLDQDVPDDLGFSLEALGHEALRLRQVMPVTTSDEEVLQYACSQACLLITCNRDDFLEAAKRVSHPGVIVLVRRKSRALERAALVRLLDRAGESGLRGNINFA